MKYLPLLLLCLLPACSSAPDASAPGVTTDCAPRREIHVVSHGWHTGVVIEAARLNDVIPALKTRFPHGRYYEIGWGDADFYQAGEVTLALALRALLASSGSVVHVVSFDTHPRQRFAGSDVRAVAIDAAGYANLLRYIASSFAYAADGQILARNSGLYGDSQFYTGSGRFHAFNTCNTWTAKALYSAGVAIDPGLRLTATSVTGAIARHETAAPRCNTQ